MLEAGRILQNRYRVEKQVGQGGMGSVYLVTDERFHSTAAIKETLFGDENLRRAFSREARLLNSLKHSALPKVTDHFVEDNGQYIVMEYIGGDDLFEMMRKSGRAFSAEEVLEWVDQLLDALHYLHEQGIIHRDIKPQNLKLTPQNNIILLDFGLAKGNPTDANFQTAPHSVFGYSRNYASLEQIQGTGTDPRSDIYSLAATAYHLLTGQVPADALTRVMMVLNENEDPLEQVGKYAPSVSQEISDALGECLALKAGSRPQNVDEMRALLKTEKHTPFAATGKNVTNAARGGLLTQKTTVFDEIRDAPSNPRSESKTEVLADTAGKETINTQFANLPTSVVPNVTAKTNRGKGRFGFAAAGALLLLIVGSIAAGIAFWPSDAKFSDANSTVPDAVKTDGQEMVPDANTSNSSDLLSGELDTNLSMPEEKPSGLSEETTGSPSAAVKSTSVAKDQPAKAGNDVRQKNVADGALIKEGTIKTRDVVVDENGVRITTPISPTDGKLTREQINRLTPSQRRRLQQKLEADRRAAEQRRKESQLRQEPTPSPAPIPARIKN